MEGRNGEGRGEGPPVRQGERESNGDGSGNGSVTKHVMIGPPQVGGPVPTGSDQIDGDSKAIEIRYDTHDRHEQPVSAIQAGCICGGPAGEEMRNGVHRPAIGDSPLWL